jgi:inward rectifier potassium channel
MRRLDDLYHHLVSASWPRLLTLLAGAFLGANALFAFAYLLQPEGIENARPGSLVDAFFFSVQTMGTIGYGKMVPRTFYTNALVTAEVFGGLLGLAMVTGLTFAKFSRPTARVLFSRQAVVSPHEGVPSLMFRMANARGNSIVEAQVHVVFAVNETTAEGVAMRRFYDLDLARRQSALFALSWTAIHPVTKQSPLHGATPSTLDAAEAEIVVSLVGLDETFSQTVHARHRYAARDIVWDARFADILVRGVDGRRSVDYAHFHEVVPLAAPREQAVPPPLRGR